MKDPIKMIEEARKKGIPTFTFIATDIHSEKVLAKYCDLLIMDENVSAEFEDEVISIQHDFSNWQNFNPKLVKSPD